MEVASKKEYLDYVLDQLSGLSEITYRPMMGEFILYYRDKVFGGIYDDRFLVKNIKAAREVIPDAELALPYEGAKEMLMVSDTDDRELLTRLVSGMYDELPAKKKGKR